jgi:periodic tryptophan protein 2
MLLTVDEDGHALAINFLKGVRIAEFHFKRPVNAIAFSPDNRWIAASHGPHVQVWRTPPLVTQFRPFALHHTYVGHFDDVLTIEWSDDSTYAPVCPLPAGPRTRLANSDCL